MYFMKNLHTVRLKGPMGLLIIELTLHRGSYMGAYVLLNLLNNKQVEKKGFFSNQLYRSMNVRFYLS